MSENIDVNRFAIAAILVAANAKHPAKYPDFDMLNAMSDSDLVAFADGLLFSLEHSSSPKDEVEAEVIDGLRGVIRGDEQQVELHVQRAALEGKCRTVSQFDDQSSIARASTSASAASSEHDASARSFAFPSSRAAAN
jgi:hypothetical protein